MIFQTEFIRLINSKSSSPKDTVVTLKGKIAAILTGLLVTQVYIFVKTHGSVYIRLYILCLKDKKAKKVNRSTVKLFLTALVF